MKFTLSDGSFAHLKSIIQTSAHLRDYAEQPNGAVAELERIALMHLPVDCWRRAPISVIGCSEQILGDQIKTKSLPNLLCIGEFVSYRKRSDESLAPFFFYVVWLQDDFTPHMAPEVEKKFQQLTWESIFQSR